MPGPSPDRSQRGGLQRLSGPGLAATAKTAPAKVTAFAADHPGAETARPGRTPGPAPADRGRFRHIAQRQAPAGPAANVAAAPCPGGHRKHP